MQNLQQAHLHRAATRGPLNQQRTAAKGTGTKILNEYVISQRKSCEGDRAGLAKRNQKSKSNLLNMQEPGGPQNTRAIEQKNLN